MKESNYVSCVVYLHKIIDLDNARKFSHILYENFLQHFQQYEVIIVDDSCDEDELKIFAGLLNKNIKSDCISIIEMADFSGMENSMLAGDDLAIGDYIFEFDNIFIDYPANLLMDVYNKCMEGYDIVSAQPQYNKYFTSNVFYSLYNYGVDDRRKIYSETFRVISRRAYNRVSDFGKFIPYRKPFYASCGLRRTTIMYNNVNSKKNKGHDTLEMSSRVGLGIDSLIIFTNTIQKVSLILSSFFLIFTFIMASYAIYAHFFGGNIAGGWVSTIVYLSMGFFGIFIILTIILRYLSIIMNMILKNKNYFVESIKKMSN